MFGNKHFEYIQLIRSDNDDNIVTKYNEIIILRQVIPSAPVLEGIDKDIIPLYRCVMKKISITVSIHPSNNKSKEDDELQIKTNSRIYLTLL